AQNTVTEPPQIDAGVLDHPMPLEAERDPMVLIIPNQYRTENYGSDYACDVRPRLAQPMAVARAGHRKQHDADGKQNGVIFRQHCKAEPHTGLRPRQVWAPDPFVERQAHDAAARREQAKDERPVRLNPAPE